MSRQDAIAHAERYFDEGGPFLLAAWKLTRESDRLYGRGTADNKGQHSINLAAVAAAIAAHGKLGFNLKVLTHRLRATRCVSWRG